MALLDRVKERFPSNLSDPELQRMIDEANQEIIDRYGPHADPALPITVVSRGLVRMLDVARPVDPAQAIVITEFIRGGLLSDETSTVLATNDWRPWNGGRTLERLVTGTKPRVR